MLNGARRGCLGPDASWRVSLTERRQTPRGAPRRASSPSGRRHTAARPEGIVGRADVPGLWRGPGGIRAQALSEGLQGFECAGDSLVEEDLGKVEWIAEDEEFMSLAIREANKAAAMDEVPVGAVLVIGGQVVARGHNCVEATKDPTAHAEMVCIRQAAADVGAWRLMQATLYVTLEPCPMCAGAALQARVGTIVYGAPNPLLGADGSWVQVLPIQISDDGDTCNARADRPHAFHPDMKVRRGVLVEECAEVMRNFFRRRRQESRQGRAR